MKPSKALKLMSSEKQKIGKWTEEEDFMLTHAVAEHGGNWVAVVALVPLRTNTASARGRTTSASKTHP
jgi:hypothetical protein